MKKNHSIQLSLRKLVLSAMVAAPLATLPTPLWALPAGMTSSSTSTSSTTVGSTLSITTPDRSVLKWTSYAVGGTESVIYNLPTTSSSVLNMVTAGGGTTIAGTVTSNGKILILDTAGITVSGNITAAGVTLSTRPETEFYYLANGDLGLTGSATAGVTVSGNISVGSAGSVLLAGKSVTVSGASVDANSTTLSGGSGGSVTVGGASALTFGNSTAKYGTLTVNTNGGSLDITNGAGAVIVAGGNASLTTGDGAITQGGAGALQIGASGTDGMLSINSGAGAVTLGLVQTVDAAKTLNVTLTKAAATSINTGATGGSLAIGGTTTSTLAVTAQKDLTLNALTTDGNLSATSTTGDLKSGGTVTLKSGAITLSAAGAGKKITYVGAGDLTFGTITSNGTGSVTLSSDGAIALPTVTTQDLSVTTPKAITQTAALTASGTSTFDAGDVITLTTAANNFGTVVLKNAPNGASVTDANALVLGKGTSVTGDTTLITTGDLTFGAAAGDTLNFGKLTITTNGGNVVQLSNNTTTGKLSITAGAGAIKLGGKDNNGVGLNNSYGQINVVSAANVLVFEKDNLDVGAVTTAGNATFYSAASISNSDKLDVGAKTFVGAGTGTAPGAIALDWVKSDGSESNHFGAAGVIVLDDINLLNAKADAPVSPFGYPLASSLSVAANTALAVTIGTNLYGTTANIPVTLKTLGANAIVSAPLNTSGAVKVTTADGAVTLNDGANKFTSIDVTSKTGSVVVSSTADLTVNATFNGSSNPASTASFTGNTITLGSISSTYSGGLSFTGNSVSDSAPGLAIYGPVSFTANNGNISITNLGHNFGGIAADSSAQNGNIAIVEGGTLKLAGAGIVAGNGTVSLTSTSQTIYGSGAKITTNGAVTLNASGGYVDVSNAANAMAGAVSLTAKGNSTVSQTTDLKLGTTVVSNGTLTVSGAKVTQSGAINAYGDTSVTGTADVVLDNTGNRFGALTLSAGAGAGNITLVEDTTVNLKSIATTSGKIAVTSLNGDIVDSGTGGIGSTGTATFTANNGSITLDNSASSYTTVSLNTNNNATIVQPSGAGKDISLAKSNVGGALTVTNQGSGFDILDSGTLTVGGNATFNTNAGAVTLDETANQFGPVRFTVGQASTLTEASTFKLNSGSIATADVTINTNGDFVTSGTGGSSFTGNLTINAIGTIKPGAGSLLVTGTLTVFSNNTKDLSGLDFAGNLASKHPVYLGTGDNIKAAGEP